MGDTHEVYPLARDEAESSRLNEQHNFLVHATEGLIDSSIPLENITTVADVGTGTGIWLFDTQQHLNAKVPNSSPRTFSGFDISSAQFPPSTPAGIELSVQDVLKPFPPEHHNRYDLVNVRMLVTGIAEKEYVTAVENLVSILSKTTATVNQGYFFRLGILTKMGIEPGGYLQWVDLDCIALPDSKDTQNPTAATVVSTWLKFFELNKLSVSAPTTVADAYKQSGLLDIVNTSFRLDDRGEDLKAKARKWQLQAFSAVMPPVMVATGRAKDAVEAREKTDEAIRELGLYFEAGEVVGLGFGRVVGRKAE